MLPASTHVPIPTIDTSQPTATSLSAAQHGYSHHDSAQRPAESFDPLLGEGDEPDGSGSEWSISPGQTPSSSNDGWLSPLERITLKDRNDVPLEFKRLSLSISASDIPSSTKTTSKKRRGLNSSPFQECPEGT